MRKDELIIAIDGPAGAGKSTVSKAVAAHLGLTLVDTGAIYRSVAYLADEANIPWDDAAQLAHLVATLDIHFEMQDDENKVFLRGKDASRVIRTPHISQGASLVSSLGPVRAGLLALQRSLAGASGAVLEGRDIGTVVCPNAPLKIFLVASAEERAMRRVAQLEKTGEPANFEAVLAKIQERDARDSQREHSPLKPAEDAIHLDCTTMNAQAVTDCIVAHAERLLSDT